MSEFLYLDERQTSEADRVYYRLLRQIGYCLGSRSNSMTYTFPPGFGVLTEFKLIPEYQKRILQTHWDLLEPGEQAKVEANLEAWRRKGSPSGYEGKSILQLRHLLPQEAPVTHEGGSEVNPTPAPPSTPQGAPGETI